MDLLAKCDVVADFNFDHKLVPVSCQRVRNHVSVGIERQHLGSLPNGMTVTWADGERNTHQFGTPPQRPSADCTCAFMIMNGELEPNRALCRSYLTEFRQLPCKRDT